MLFGSSSRGRLRPASNVLVVVVVASGALLKLEDVDVDASPLGTCVVDDFAAPIGAGT